ncbi:response regulator [Polyangium aurulentum]|uniref:response regulator n=1 Tax=Polyangium aurulentum TaxID=2567896 RepID=UPI0010AE9082|nr:response regulator [Polyangium aurulentum]UQA58334.1 response regulator [Polyangium aurulentum]
MPRVLIVDSEGNQSRSLALALQLEGFHVEVTSSQQDAMALLGGAPDLGLVLIDLMIPGLNGLDLARSIRRTRPSIVIVLTSAYPLSQRQLERTECGAIGFVPKPYDTDEVSAYVRSKATAAFAAG